MWLRFEPFADLSAEPEHSEMTAGRTPASSRARDAPTTDASAPLPPVATSARRSSVDTDAAKGATGGKGDSGGRPSSCEGIRSSAFPASDSSPASSRTPPITSRARVATLKYCRSRKTSSSALSMARRCGCMWRCDQRTKSLPRPCPRSFGVLRTFGPSAEGWRHLRSSEINGDAGRPVP